jgi:hypothetical protein
VVWCRNTIWKGVRNAMTVRRRQTTTPFRASSRLTGVVFSLPKKLTVVEAEVDRRGLSISIEA